MNAKPTFIPELSQWKVQCFAGMSGSVFWRKAKPLWQDCKEEMPVTRDRFSHNPVDPVEIYQENDARLILFGSRAEAIDWMKLTGLTECNDIGEPFTRPNGFALEKQFTSDETQHKKQDT